MASDKYDIPYAMKPKGKGKGKGKDKSKYTAYIQSQNRGYLSSLSPDARKLLLYVVFFSIFAYIFLTTLRNSKVPAATEYELDLDYSNSRERNLIDDSLDNNRIPSMEEVENEQFEDDTDGNVEATGSEIDVLVSDEDELSGEMERKTIKKKKNSKGQNKPSNSDFEAELDEMIQQGNKKLSEKKNKNIKKGQVQKDVTDMQKNDKIKRVGKEEIKREAKNGKKY